MLNNFITDFNPPVKRPGMHKNRMIRHSVYALCSETEVLMISLSIKFKSLMTFKLNSEHHHRISFFYRFVERKFLNKGLIIVLRKKVTRARNNNFHSKLFGRNKKRAGHPGIFNVSTDSNGKTF